VLFKRPIVFTVLLSALVVCLAALLSVLSYQLVGRYHPGVLYQIECAVVIASILAPIFLYPLITTAAHLRRATGELKRLATTDALTGLPNSLALSEELARLFDNVGRGTGFAAHFIDLDGFKEVNDTHGHPAGDALLEVVGLRLVELLGPSGFVARFGGDEFVVVQPALVSAADAADLAHSIVKTLSRTYEIDGKETRVGATVGIAVAPSDGTGPAELLRAADVALYRAKAQNRGTVVFFDSAMDAEAQARRLLEADLRNALASGQFELQFQPLFQRHTLKIGTCEALLRWRHPEHGLVPPERFIQMAERIGAIVEIGNWVLREACLECTRWPSPTRVAVNLSPVQFARGEVVSAVKSALQYAGLPADRLEVEITESVLLRDTEANRIALNELRAMGVHISLDDFGTGFSGLNYLHSFRLDKVKIDRVFVASLVSSTRSRTLLRGIARLSAELGLSVAVEGIENEEQARVIASEPNISEVQGFLLSPPLPRRRIAELLMATSSGGVAIGAARAAALQSTAS
jgi:diguanylate cyclase (GGDEF)-like protein